MSTTTSSMDALVATYAVLGMRRRQQRRRSLLWKILAAVGLAALATAALRIDWPIERGLKSGALHEQVSTELEQLSLERAELEGLRQWFETRREELAEQFGRLERQSQALEAQRQSLEAQSAELAATIAAVDAERAALALAQSQRPVLRDEIAAIAAQRQTLEERLERFDAEDDQLHTELEVLNQQRQALEAQRQQMEQQRRELEALLDEAARGTSETAPTAAIHADELPAVAELMPVETLALYAELVEEHKLAQMRAGIRLGDGMNVSVGLTRTASINGIEQVRSTLNLDDFGAELSAPLIIQNGAGNVLGAGFLDGLTSSFGTVIQNTLDGQDIRTETIYDVSIQDVTRAINGLAADQALSDSLRFQR